MAGSMIDRLTSNNRAEGPRDPTALTPAQTKLLEEYYKLYEKCMKPEDMKTVFEGAFTHGRESSNHLIVRWDELNQIWGNTLDPMFNDPNADVKAILTQVEQETNNALERIKAEQGQ